MERNVFIENIEKLEKSPVFAMSLGSKELFHSNFWAYLMEQEECRSFITFFFEEITNFDGIRIEREDKNRDLVIFYQGNEYVIENKIKSYPDYSQLVRYSENTKLKRGIITGITEPPFDLPDGWSFISYHNISSFLRTLSISDSHLKMVVSDYCDVLDSINTLMELSLEETSGRLSYWTENIKGLYKVRLMDVYRKIKADDFVIHCEDINQEMNELLQDCPNWKFGIFRSFHNGKSTISFEIQKGSEETYKGKIGVQIEDNQFRIFLELNSGNVGDIFKIGLDENWFDDNFDKKNNRTIFKHPTTMSKNPCSYSGHWVYQYFDTYNDSVEPVEDIQDYGTLKDLIKEYLKKAVHIIKSKGKELFK